MYLDPVLASDGNIYEHEAIKNHFIINGLEGINSSKPFESMKLKPDERVKNIIKYSIENNIISENEQYISSEQFVFLDKLNDVRETENILNTQENVESTINEYKKKLYNGKIIDDMEIKSELINVDSLQELINTTFAKYIIDNIDNIEYEYKIKHNLGFVMELKLIHIICMYSNIQIFEYIINKLEINNFEIKDNQNRTIFYIACEYNNLEIVKYLYEKKVNIYSRHIYGYNGLMIAAFKEHEKIVKFLIDKNYCLDITDNIGRNVLNIACGVLNNIEIVKYIVDACAFLDIPDNNGNNALLVACSKGNIEIVKYLVNKGADINYCFGKNNYAPIMSACAGGNIEIVKYLKDSGAYMNVLTKGGSSLLSILDYSKDMIDLLEYLYELGFNPNHTNSFGKTCIYYALESKNLINVKYLVEHGANLNIIDKEGKTIIEYAKVNSTKEIYDYILTKYIGQLQIENNIYRK